MAKTPTNLGASVRAHLLKLARADQQPYDLVLTRFALERLLYRLSISKHADRFVLKGAMLMSTWFDDPKRPTRDLDLLGFGDPDEAAMLDVFRDVMAIDDEDGIRFDTDSLRIGQIREKLEYGGVRLRANADIDGAKIALSIDIGFGDATEPGLETLDYPVLLGHSAPQLRGYARETVIAEKFQAIVMLGRANSRMKDFYDLWLLSTSFELETSRLAAAVSATFARRKTDIPEHAPDGLTQAFATDPAKVAQWRAFKDDLGNDPGALTTVCEHLAGFLMPIASAASAQGSPPA